MAISKSRRGSCFSLRNRNRLLPSPLDLHLAGLLFLALLLASCSALAIDSSTTPTEVNEDTTIIPAQIEESTPTPTSINRNETRPLAHPVENPKAETTDPAASVDSSAEGLTDSFVSDYNTNLEQDIINDVNREVEDAPSPAEETVSKVAAVVTENRETETPIQNPREPKTLEAETEERKPVEEIAPVDQAKSETAAVSSDQVETRTSTSRPLPPVTSDLVSVILNEDSAITEQPITKINALALEEEHKAVDAEENTTPVPIYEETKHQVTKKQGVENLFPIEVPRDLDEPETARDDRQLEETNINLNEIDGNTSEDDKAIPTIFSKAGDELQEKIEKQMEEKAKAELEEQVEGTATPPETVVEAADSDDSQPGEEADIPEATEKIISEETKPIEKEPTEAEPKQEELKEGELKEEELKEEVLKQGGLKERELKEEEPKEEEPKEEESQKYEPKEEEAEQEESQKNEPKEEVTQKNEPKDEEPEQEEPQEEEHKEEEPKEVEAKETELKEEEPQEEVTIHHIDSEQPIILANPSSSESVEDKEEDPESVEDKKKGANSDSSEEIHEPAAADEAKPSSSDDSTATPLVSYPPHNAGQTFDSNSADEHSAQLSNPSNYRSTLIIALCSGTAVIFIVASLVIFVVSFQRQHGTLDIEMQEQRLGKDDRDEEDAQVKLLEVDLSTPVIVSLGNEETDECL